MEIVWLHPFYPIMSKDHKDILGWKLSLYYIFHKLIEVSIGTKHISIHLFGFGLSIWRKKWKLENGL